MEWLTNLTQWITDLIKSLWLDFVNFGNDFFVGIAESVLMGIGSLIIDIPVPTFLDGHSIGDILGLMPSSVLYFLSLMHINEGFSLIASAFIFRMARKALTLFQW